LTFDFRPALASLICAGLVAAAPEIRAAEPPASSLLARPFSATLLLGIESGLALGAATANRRLAAELSQTFVGDQGRLTELSLATRTSATGWWLGGRIGYQLASFGYEGATRRDLSHGADLGLLAGATSDRGSTIALELGVEQVWREYFFCCDSGLAASSRGLRALLTGQLALGDRYSLSARIGVRTAEHVQEIKVLPLLMLGWSIHF
jgi:hypothetical protein